jgi:hypothetical protein
MIDSILGMVSDSQIHVGTRGPATNLQLFRSAKDFFGWGPLLGRLAAGEFRAKIKEHSELIESYQPLGRCYGPQEPYSCPYQDRLVIPPGCFNVNPAMIIPRVNV